MYLQGFSAVQAPPSVRTRIGRLPRLTTKFMMGWPPGLTKGDCSSNWILTLALVLIRISVPASVTRVSGCDAGGSDRSSGTATSMPHAGGQLLCWAEAGGAVAVSTTAAKRTCTRQMLLFIV